MAATLTFTADLAAIQGADRLFVVGRKQRLLDDDVQAALPADLGREIWERMVKGIEPGDDGRSASTYTPSCKVIVGVLPEPCSRHNTPSRATSLPRLLKGAGARKDCAVLLVLTDAEHALAAACGLARSLPTYSATTRNGEHTVTAALLGPGGPVADVGINNRAELAIGPEASPSTPTPSPVAGNATALKWTASQPRSCPHRVVDGEPRLCLCHSVLVEH